MEFNEHGEMVGDDIVSFTLDRVYHEGIGYTTWGTTLEKWEELGLPPLTIANCESEELLRKAAIVFKDRFDDEFHRSPVYGANVRDFDGIRLFSANHTEEDWSQATPEEDVDMFFKIYEEDGDSNLPEVCFTAVTSWVYRAEYEDKNLIADEYDSVLSLSHLYDELVERVINYKVPSNYCAPLGVIVRDSEGKILFGNYVDDNVQKMCSEVVTVTSEELNAGDHAYTVLAEWGGRDYTDPKIAEEDGVEVVEPLDEDGW